MFFLHVTAYINVMCILPLCVGEVKFALTDDTWFCQTDVKDKLAAY